MDEEFLKRINHSGTLTGYFAQSSEACGYVRQAEVLSQL
jgi:hypothetical protein